MRDNFALRIGTAADGCRGRPENPAWHDENYFKHFYIMEFKKFLLVAAVAAFTTVSCNKENGVNPSESVAGTYTGYSMAEFQYSPEPMVSENQTLTITSTGEGTVSVNYKSDTWGTFTVTGAQVAGDGGVFSISGEGVTLMGMEAGSEQEYPCTFTGTVNSDMTDYSFVFDIPAVMGGLKITFLPAETPVE